MNNIILSTILPERKYIQLGLHNLKTYALQYCQSKKNLKIELYEINTNKNNYIYGSVFPYLSKEDIFSHAIKILKKKPMIVGFSCFMWNVKSILQICKLIKTINKDITIVLGGAEASAEPENILHKNTYIDIIVLDEGEISFAEILDAIILKREVSKIKGIVYRQNGIICRSENGSVVDLQKLPSPYLNHQIKLDRTMSLALETSRGCPFSCSYCTYSIRGYHKLRFIPLDRILKEIRYILKQNPKSLRITDDNFNINPPRAALILKQVTKYIKDTDIKIFLNASMWKIDKGLIQLLKKVDMTCSVGVQSINSLPLKHISRKNDFRIFEDNLKTFDEMGLKYELSFILGLPGEDYAEFKDSINWAFRFNPIEVNIFPLMVFKGTKMSEDSRKLGLTTYCEPFYTIKETKKISQLNIKKGLVLREHIGLLYNKGLLKNTLRYIAKQYDLSITSVVEKWGKCKVLQHTQKGSKHVQKELVSAFINKYGNKVDTTVLAKIMKEDYRYFTGQ